MPIWILVIVVTLTWWIEVVASASAAAVEDIKHPLESGQNRGASIVPGLLVMPVVFVLVALGVDVFFDTPWGSRVVVGAHLLFATMCAFLIVRNYRQLPRRTGAD